MTKRSLKGAARLLVWSFSLALGLQAAGAQAIWTTSQSIPSSNGHFACRLSQQATGTCQAEMIESSSGLALWSQWIDWDHQSVGIASNDGKVFAVLNSEYGPESTLIQISRQDGREGYGAANIVIARQFLSRDGGKLLWIKDVEKNASFEYASDGTTQALNLHAVDGKVYRIRL